jgi:NAD(P)-dependent dehydrogenase (short-subunit alcohol dehydrogenase family)
LSKNHVITILTSHQAIARVWTRAGAEGVVISGRRKEKLDESVRSLEALNTGSTTFLAVVTDVSKEADTNNLFAQVSKTFGRAADVVFASAGVGPPPVPLAEDNVKTWWSTFVSVSSMDAKPAR